MRDFAQDLRWTPSYEVRGSFGVNTVGGHLVVEHGLENTATISFLKAPHRASDLDPAQLRPLLTVSYNNLVEWHLFISEDEVRWINNLAERDQDERADQVHRLTARDTIRYLSAAHLSGPGKVAAVQRTLKACDESLLQVISRWKRLLRADYPAAENRNIAALFNALILIRGCEDRDMD
jgi:hypothetical protein